MQFLKISVMRPPDSATSNCELLANALRKYFRRHTAKKLNPAKSKVRFKLYFLFGVGCN
jgi:hypothetical protein